MILALFSCRPRGVSMLAMSFQLASTAASGVGYVVKKSHNTGRAALPVMEREREKHGCTFFLVTHTNLL